MAGWNQHSKRGDLFEGCQAGTLPALTAGSHTTPRAFRRSYTFSPALWHSNRCRLARNYAAVSAWPIGNGRLISTSVCRGKYADYELSAPLVNSVEPGTCWKWPILQGSGSLKVCQDGLSACQKPFIWAFRRARLRVSAWDARLVDCAKGQVTATRR
jgi:hypothetical protein